MKKGYKKISFDIMVILSPLLLFPFKKLVLSIGEIVANERLSTESINIIKSGVKKNSLNIQWIVILCLILLLYFKVRTNNKQKEFNFGNEYMNYPYWIFYLAGKVLGIKSIKLQLVPIYLQAKIIISDTFSEILYQENLENVDSKSTSKLIYNGSRTLTLVLEDTYLINEKQLSVNLRNTDILRVTKGNLKENVRNYSPNFIETIDSNIFKLEKKYQKINICATTNTKHTFKIVSNNFKKGKRGDINSLVIYQQNRDQDRMFEKGYEIEL